MHDPQDKRYWVDNEEEERAFVDAFGARLRLIINPAKGQDRYAPDLFRWEDMRLADLKVQATPFRTAGTKYGIDPASCVTLNVSDLLHYSVRYGGRFLIFFWLRGDRSGVYMANCRQIEQDIRMRRRPIHEYTNRDGRDGNKTHSYVLDVNAFERVA